MAQTLYRVIVKPGSRKGPLVVQTEQNLTVYLREKPIDGAANQALIVLLAKHFQVAKTSIKIKSGLRSRQKLIMIDQW